MDDNYEFYVAGSCGLIYRIHPRTSTTQYLSTRDFGKWCDSEIPSWFFKRNGKRVPESIVVRCESGYNKEDVRKVFFPDDVALEKLLDEKI